MKKLLLFVLVGLMFSCGSEKPSESEVDDIGGIESMVSTEATATPIVPSIEELTEVLKQAGGRTIGVTNEGLYVIEKVDLIAFNPQSKTSWLARVKLEGYLSEPWLNMNEAYEKGQELIYKGEYELNLGPTGRWELGRIVSLQRVNIEESPATIITPILDDDEEIKDVTTEITE